MSGQKANKWQQVADLITRLGLVIDPVRATIYNQDWADKTVEIQRRLQPQPQTAAHQQRTRPCGPPTSGTARHSPPRPQQSTAAAKTVSGPSTTTPREPKPVPGWRNNWRGARRSSNSRRKKGRPGSWQASKHQLAKQPGTISDPKTASQPPYQPITPEGMEVDTPTTKSSTSEEPVPSTNSEQHGQKTEPEARSEDAWL
ncbi:hypothetical protein QTP88_026764 [Uroleucon formosanum]